MPRSTPADRDELATSMSADHAGWQRAPLASPTGAPDCRLIRARVGRGETRMSRQMAGVAARRRDRPPDCLHRDRRNRSCWRVIRSCWRVIPSTTTVFAECRSPCTQGAGHAAWAARRCRKAVRSALVADRVGFRVEFAGQRAQRDAAVWGWWACWSGWAGGELRGSRPESRPLDWASPARGAVAWSAGGPGSSRSAVVGGVATGSGSQPGWHRECSVHGQGW